jgi:transcription elongation factor Elf1
MLITCSYCNARYSIATDRLRDMRDSIFICQQCQRSIKIAFCPYCDTSYSITFPVIHRDRYSFRCKRCEGSFIVEFPVVEDTVEIRRSTLEGVSPERRKRAKEDSNKRIIHRPRDERGEPSGRGIAFKDGTFNEFNLRELLIVCSGAFSRTKLIVSASGLMVLFLIMLLYSEINGFLFNSFLVRNSQFLKSLLNLLPVFLFFFVIILILAIISRITLERIFLDSVWNFRKTLRYISKIAMPVFISNILILFLVNLVFILFGRIPIVGPVLYSILFFPIYLISLLIIITLIIGFWFYPPILAYKEVGILKNVIHLFHFVKRHNLSLILIIPILTIISSIFFTIIYLLHLGVFSFTIFLSKLIMQDNVERLFSAMPLSLMRKSDLSFVGTDMSIYKSFMSDLLLSHQIGGIIIGVVLATISIFLFASYISVIGTISSHVYIIMERDIAIPVRNKIKLLFIVVLILLGIYILKRIYL